MAVGSFNFSQMLPTLLAILNQGGSVGQQLTPAQQQIAAASGAVTPQDAATATVAGVQPGGPNPAAMAGSNAALAALAQKLQGNGQPPMQPRVAPQFRSGGGAPPAPIASAPIKPALPQQRPMPAPQSVGAMSALSDPQMAALVKQLQQLNSATGLT